MASKKAVPHYQFTREFPKSEPQSVYLVSGDEEFLKERIMKMIMNRFLTKQALEFDYVTLHGDECTGSEIVEQADTMPFIAENRVVVVREIDLVKTNQHESIISYLKEPSFSTILIVTARKIDARSRLYKAFQANATIIQCKTPYNADGLARWIRDELRDKQVRIDSSAIQYLASHIKLDYFTANNELEKLLLYVGKKNMITLNDVKQCIAISNESNVFDLQNSLGRRDIRQTVSILESFENLNDSAVMIITMISRYFLTLWKVHALRAKNLSDNEIMENHMHEVYKLFRNDRINAANRYSATEIKTALSLMYDCDKKLKSISTKSNILLTTLMYNICMR